MELEFEKPIRDIEAKIEELTKQNEVSVVDKADEKIAELKKELSQVKKEIYSKLTAWQTVQVARHPNRPLIRDYIENLCSEFIEMSGDRCFGNDKSIIGGFATIEGFKVMLIGHQKGKNVDDNVKFNFGMANPEGYRKALRLMKLAEQFNIPVISLIDTPGAYPGLDAEARGQAEAIARNLTEMARLETPIIVIVTGEGGSGGALGIGVGDIVMMLSNSVYSVISPEGCASILWRDGAKAPEAAEALKITAKSLYDLKVIDEIIQEPYGGAHSDYPGTMNAVKNALLKHIKRLTKINTRKLVDKRYEKLVQIGRFE